MIFTVDLLPTNQTPLWTENYGRTAQLSPHQARTAGTSTAPPSTLGPFGPDGARSDGISESRAIRQVQSWRKFHLLWACSGCSQSLRHHHFRAQMWARPF